MGNEPSLVFKLSQPNAFQCSACDEHGGAFGAEGWVVDLIEAFQDHVLRYHPKQQKG
jgi:hypothetical protein